MPKHTVTDFVRRLVLQQFLKGVSKWLRVKQTFPRFANVFFASDPNNRTIMIFDKSAATYLIATVICITFIPTNVNGILRRCVSCRSRGELGSCKDSFTMNATQIEHEHGVDAVPCASGWCGKIIESQSLNNEYGTATQRMCLQRGPDDNEERCAYTVWNYKKVYMCFCLGDLCNVSSRSTLCGIWLLVVAVILARWFD